MDSAVNNATGKTSRPKRLSAGSASPSNNRSAVTNRRTVLAGADGRSARGRRFKDLCVALAEPFGNFENLTEEEATLIRHAAAVTMIAEEMQLAIANGEAVDNDALIRTTNALARVMAALETRAKKAKKRESAPTLEEIAQRHRGGAK